MFESLPSGGKSLLRAYCKYYPLAKHCYKDKLKLYMGADRVRKVDDEDCYYAIRYPDKEPASRDEWYALLYARGMDEATRKTIVMDVVGASWSHVGGRPFSGGPLDCQWLADRECCIGPWTSAHYQGQRRLPPLLHRKASARQEGPQLVPRPIRRKFHQRFHNRLVAPQTQGELVQGHMLK